jgi:phosphatidylinositol alpha-1,6-mannosyltransferase
LKIGSALLIAKAYPPVVGGIETYSEEVARAYLARGISVTVVTQTEGAASRSERLYPEGRVQLYNTGPGRQAVVFLRLLFILRRLLARQRFDMVHVTTWRPALALLPWRRQCPMVVTVHGREVLNYPFFLKRPMIEVLRRADILVTVSSATMAVAREALFGHTARGIWKVALNGISFPDAARSSTHVPSLENSPVQLLTLARHVPRKNIDGCLRALAALRDEGLRFNYLVAGRGPMHEALKSLVRELGLDNTVTFLGYVPDSALPDLYRKSDVFLHPQTNVGDGNDFEGFGLVIADAMSFGCAVLAGVAGGPRDFICDRQTGILVDGLDQDAITAAIRELILDAVLRKRIADAGRSYALKQLSWNNHIDVILSGVSGTLVSKFSEAQKS